MEWPKSQLMGLINCTLKYVRNFFITSWTYKTYLKWDPPFLNAQFIRPCQIYVNLNIALNMRECFRLTGFWAILYRSRPIFFPSYHNPLDFSILTLLGKVKVTLSLCLTN
jgi:hypothetical protein